MLRFPQSEKQEALTVGRKPLQDPLQLVMITDEEADCEGRGLDHFSFMPSRPSFYRGKNARRR